MTAQGSCFDELRQARRSILSIAARIYTSFAEPTDFLQHLASQNQLLACLQWLGEFQVLAYIPLSGSVPMNEISELVGVSVNQLSRIVRMTATAGFLHEPQPGCIAHTALSAPFVNNLSYLDAAMFLAKTAAPTALHMTAAMQRHGGSESPIESAYSLAFNTAQTFQGAYKQRAKLQREWHAYLKCTEERSDGVAELLGKLDFHGLGKAVVVDVGANSTETASSLSKLYPLLNFVVQMEGPAYRSHAHEADLSPCIEVQIRSLGAVQTVKDAALYLIRFPALSLRVSPHTLQTRILTELRAHLNELHSNTCLVLILPSCLLPEPGSVELDVEAMARIRDLSRLQLSNEHEIEITELVEWVNSVYDSQGLLVVVNKLCLRNSWTMGLVIKYQTHQVGIKI